MHDPRLRRAYLRCRALNAEHGKSYYLATLLLPPAKRPAVHALYGFARWVDDVIDEGTGPVSVTAQARLLDDIEAMLRAEPDKRDQPPEVAAVRDTIRRWELPTSYFVDFLASMRMDLTVTEYATYEDLERYMWGSAAVIGLQMLPVLQPTTSLADAAPFATDLGIAFQLTNFLRDVGDDLRRGRIYLPMDSLARHGVDRDRLGRGVVDGPVRRLLADEIARTRELYRRAAPGVELLHRDSRDCIRTALRLYSGILDQIERSGYRVLDQRVRVSTTRRLAIAVPGAVRATASRAFRTRAAR